jgi:hypothetical protein
MSLLDLLIVLVFFVLVALAKIALTPYSLAVLVLLLCVERVLKGERL